MKAKLNADHTNELFKKTEKLVTEAILRFTEDGLEVTTADPAKVAMINLEVPENSFNEYEIDYDKEEYEHIQEEGEEGLLIGVNLENLASIVKLFDDEITFTVEESNLVLTEEDDKFELPILNLSTDDIPSIGGLDDFKLKGEMTTDQMKTLVKKLTVASDSTTAELNDEGELTVKAGGDQITVESSFDLGNLEKIDEDTESAQSMFSLDYLKKAKNVFKSLDTCNDVEVKMGEDFPMKITHEHDRENFEFVLAPRIEEE